MVFRWVTNFANELLGKRDGGDNQQLREILVNFGESTDAIDDFRNAFQLSAMPSIDSFLARREKFIKVGKAAVAATIKPE